MRKAEEKDILKLAHQLIHFLLSVTGAFPHHHIGKIKEGALVGFRKAVARLNQWAKILR